jgi:hypothetical protein
MIRSILVLMSLAALVFSVPIVNLKIKETANIARTNEDITMGVPLPEAGAYTDTSMFTLRDGSGNIIPCEFKTLNTWYKNTTYIRWLQLNFPYSIAANDSQYVTLHSETSPYSQTSKLTVVDNGTTVTVNTGKIRFIVKKANFNMIDQAWVDESGSENYTDNNKVIASHTRGLVFYDSLDVEYLSSSDAASTLAISRRGAGVVTLTARGVLKNGADAPLNFICRIYAFNNSPTVRVYMTVENWNPTTESFVGFKGFHAEVPLNLGATRTAVVGKPAGYEQAVLSGASELYSMVKRADTSTTTMGQAIQGSIGGAVTTTFDPKPTKPKDLGWVSLSDGSRGCLAAMKYFWQMVPASAEAFADGKLLLGLFSKRSNQHSVMFYAGAARTYETEFTFFNAQTPDQARSKALGATDRLFAVAAPEWYSRIAIAAFPMMEVNKQSYYDTNWTAVSAWETTLRIDWSSVLNWDLNVHHSYDQYGFLEWGDNTHYDASGSSGWIQTFPWKILWNGNYYGLPFFSFEHFFHTGDIRFLNYGIAHARHVQDIQMVHFGPGASTTGGSRYSPPAYHFSTDDDPTTVPGTFWIDNPSHHAVEGCFLEYYLTGNDYAIEVAMQGADWFNTFGTYYTSPGEEINTYIRRWSHQMFSQIAAYTHTHNAKYYNTIYQNWEAIKNDIRSNQTIGQQFMAGLAMEAMVKMYYILSPTYRTTGGVDVPDSIPYFLRMWANRVAFMPIGTGSTQVNANTTLGYAFLSKFYGSMYNVQAKLHAASLSNSPSNLHKDFAQQGRNMEMAMYYMANPDSLNPVGTEDFSLKEKEGRLRIKVNPTPFNPTARIELSGNVLKEKPALRLRVYSTSGRLVADLSNALDPQSHTVLFKADGLASGVYVVRCEVGTQAVTQRMTLLR